METRSSYFSIILKIEREFVVQQGNNPKHKMKLKTFCFDHHGVGYMVELLTGQEDVIFK